MAAESGPEVHHLPHLGRRTDLRLVVPRYCFDTPREGTAVLKAPGMEAVKETARRVSLSRLQRIGSKPVSSATRAGERDRLWPEVWSTTRKKSTR
jgi:hypothetical protein